MKLWLSSVPCARFCSKCPWKWTFNCYDKQIIKFMSQCTKLWSETTSLWIPHFVWSRKWSLLVDLLIRLWLKLSPCTQNAVFSSSFQPNLVVVLRKSAENNSQSINLFTSIRGMGIIRGIIRASRGSCMKRMTIKTVNNNNNNNNNNNTIHFNKNNLKMS